MSNCTRQRQQRLIAQTSVWRTSRPHFTHLLEDSPIMTCRISLRKPQTSFYCTDNSFHLVHVIYSIQVFTLHLSVEAGSRAVYGSKSGSFYLCRIQNVFLCDLGLELSVMSYLSGEEVFTHPMIQRLFSVFKTLPPRKPSGANSLKNGCRPLAVPWITHHMISATSQGLIHRKYCANDVTPPTCQQRFCSRVQFALVLCLIVIVHVAKGTLKWQLNTTERRTAKMTLTDGDGTKE